MFTHLVKLIWNKKKQNFLLILELFVSFIGLFAGLTFVFHQIHNYRLPTGLVDEHVWVVDLHAAEEVKNVDSLQIFRGSLREVVQSIGGVQDVSYSSSNLPFSGNFFNIGLDYNGLKTWANIYTVEDNHARVLGMKLLEGRWFSPSDIVSNIQPVVINDKLKSNLFPREDALGKVIALDGGDKMKVIGVVMSAKYESAYEMPTPGLYRRMDTSNMRQHISMLIKVTPGADPALESRVYKTLANAMRNGTVEIDHLAELKKGKNDGMRIPFIVFTIIATFLIMNVALGIFAVLWYNINKRKGEIGLRRAVGATGRAISWQLVCEAILMATLSLLLGLFFAVQFPLLSVFDLPVQDYVSAIIYSVLFIYALVILCALYPGKQAAAVYPAGALHED